MNTQRGGAGRGVGKPEDVVYTPGWCAEDMVEHFDPTGVVLDPCRGLGAFHNLLPDGSPWCEITEGTDFFDWTTPVDWVIGNPPYSLTRPWFKHSYSIADHLVYLVPLRNVFSAYGFVREMHEFGGIRDLRIYGTGGTLGFPMGNAVGAFHCERGWRGGTDVTFYDPLPAPCAPETQLSSVAGTAPEDERPRNLDSETPGPSPEAKVDDLMDALEKSVAAAMAANRAVAPEDEQTGTGG